MSPRALWVPPAVFLCFWLTVLIYSDQALTAEVHTLIGGSMVAIMVANNNEEPAPAKGKIKPSVTFEKARRFLKDALEMCQAKDGSLEIVNRL